MVYDHKTPILDRAYNDGDTKRLLEGVNERPEAYICLAGGSFLRRSAPERALITVFYGGLHTESYTQASLRRKYIAYTNRYLVYFTKRYIN